MRDRYIDAVLHHLHRRERASAEKKLRRRFAEGTDDRATIAALGHPFACSLTLTDRPKALLRGEYRLHYRKSLALAMILSATIVVALLLIPPLFRPVRITAAYVALRALAGIAGSALFSAAAITLLFLLLGVLGVRLSMPRWDEAAIAHFLGEDELVIPPAQLRSHILSSLLWLTLLLFLMVKPEAVTLQGRAIFTASIRVGIAGWLLLLFASMPLWTAKRKSGAWTRALFLWDTMLEAVMVLYSAVLLSRWGVYDPAFVALVGMVRLKIVVTALSGVWIALTVLERANDAYTVFTGTAPPKASQAAPR